MADAPLIRAVALAPHATERVVILSAFASGAVYLTPIKRDPAVFAARFMRCQIAAPLYHRGNNDG